MPVGCQARPEDSNWLIRGYLPVCKQSSYEELGEELRLQQELGVVFHTCIPNTWEEEVGES